jgi:putative oxidoreductase
MPAGRDSNGVPMRYSLFDRQRDELILAGRVLLMALFVIYGWSKLTGFSGTIGYMASVGAPAPALSAAIATIMEFFVGLALVVGFYTRPLALLMAIYAVGATVIGHHFWTLTGADRMGSAINFYKNVSIIGGLLMLCAVGPGKYSVDGK